MSQIQRWNGSCLSNCSRADMVPEIAAAVGFVSSLLRTRGCVSEQQLQIFSGALEEALTGEDGALPLRGVCASGPRFRGQAEGRLVRLHDRPVFLPPPSLPLCLGDAFCPIKRLQFECSAFASPSAVTCSWDLEGKIFSFWNCKFDFFFFSWESIKTIK